MKLMVYYEFVGTSRERKPNLVINFYKNLYGEFNSWDFSIYGGTEVFMRSMGDIETL